MSGGKRKCFVYLSDDVSEAVNSLTADGLVVCAEGYGDPEHSGLDKIMGESGDGSFYYKGSESTPYRHALYRCGDFHYIRDDVVRLRELGSRSIIVCVGRNTPEGLIEETEFLLRKHSADWVVMRAQ